MLEIRPAEKSEVDPPAGDPRASAKSWTAHSVESDSSRSQSEPGLTMPSILRIVVVDSDVECRTSLRKILGGTPGAVVVGNSARSGSAARDSGSPPGSRAHRGAGGRRHRDADASAEAIRKFVGSVARSGHSRHGKRRLGGDRDQGHPGGGLRVPSRPEERADLTAALEKVTRVPGADLRQRPEGRPRALGVLDQGRTRRDHGGDQHRGVPRREGAGQYAPDRDSTRGSPTSRPSSICARPTRCSTPSRTSTASMSRSFAGSSRGTRAGSGAARPAPDGSVTQLNGEAGQGRARDHPLALRQRGARPPARHVPGTFAGLEASDGIMCL